MAIYTHFWQESHAIRHINSHFLIRGKIFSSRKCEIRISRIKLPSEGTPESKQRKLGKFLSKIFVSIIKPYWHSGKQTQWKRSLHSLSIFSCLALVCNTNLEFNRKYWSFARSGSRGFRYFDDWSILDAFENNDVFCRFSWKFLHI